MSEKGAAQRNGPAPHSDILAPFGKKRLVWGGKTQKKSAKKFLRLLDTHKMYILQKNWTKTVNPALSSGLNFFPPPIWGHHHQLDDQQRNPNMNNRDHLVGQLTRAVLHSCNVLKHFCAVCEQQPSADRADLCCCCCSAAQSAVAGK